MNHTIQLNEALSIFSDHLVDIRKACVENAKHIMSTPHKEWNIDDKPTIENLMLHVYHIDVTDKLAPLERTIKRIDGRNQHCGVQPITEADIERAKEHPIAELFTQLTGGTPRHGMVSCPFHGEDSNPSMSLRRHNRYRCFACDEKGDVIDLYMKLNEVSFIQAVRALQ